MNAPDLLFEIGRWSVDAVWLPMLVWTALALPISVTQRLVAGISPHTRYLTTIGLLTALPVGMMIGAFVAFDAGSVRYVAAVATISAYVTPTLPSAGGAGSAWTYLHSAGALTPIAVLLAIMRGVMLIGAVRELSRIASGAAAAAPAGVRAAARDLAGRMGISENVQLLVSDIHPSPLTFGWRSPVVLIPERLLAAPRDLRLALAHEFVHIRRHDYLWQLWEHLVGALFSIHPLVAILRTEASILREITCDADVLALTGERSRYARLLFRYSTGSDAGRQLAVGILMRENHLRKRIDAMRNLLDFARLNRSKRVGLAVSAVLLTLTVVVVACSDALVDSSSRHSGAAGDLTEDSSTDDGVYVIVEQMPELIGGLASIQSNLRYTELAKKAGVSGRVIVQFIVNERGEVTDPTIVRGIGSGLDEAALEAVRKAAFKPGMQRGEPVPVKISLPITFALDSAGDPSGAALRNGEMKADKAAADFANVDQIPEIVGGLQAIMQDVRYPAAAAQAGIEGRVLVEFVVTKEGTARDARVVAGVGSGLDEEALRAVAKARFTPAMKDGEPVPMKLTLPFTFRLPGEQGPDIRIDVDSNGEVVLNGKRMEVAALSAELGKLGLERDALASMRVAQDAPEHVVRRAQEELRSYAREIDYKVVRP